MCQTETLSLTSLLKWGTGCLQCGLVVDNWVLRRWQSSWSSSLLCCGAVLCFVVRLRKLSGRSSSSHLNLKRVTHPVILLIRFISRHVQADLWTAWRRSLCQSSRCCEPAEWQRVCCQSEYLIWVPGFTSQIVLSRPNKCYIPQYGGSVRIRVPKLYLMDSNADCPTCCVTLGMLLNLLSISFLICKTDVITEPL